MTRTGPLPPVTSATHRPVEAAEELAIGTARERITGSWNAPLQGYVKQGQRAREILQDLNATAIAISDRDGGTSILVSAELQGLDSAIFRTVAARVKEEFPEIDESNILIGATHSHAATGGYFLNLAYMLTDPRWSEQDWNILVDGLSDVILAALRDRSPGVLSVTEGEMHGVGHNRSPEAHRADPRSEKFPEGVDPRVAAFVAQSIDPATGRPGATQAIAANNAVHPTTVSATVNAVHGDNKGYARERLEEALGAPVLMFSGAQGDNSPNGPELARSGLLERLLLGLFGRRGREKFDRPGTEHEPFAHMFESGAQQAGAILPLVAEIQADTEGRLRVEGPIQTFRTWVDFSSVELANGERTQPPMIGKDTLAGTEDQRGIEVGGFPVLREGVKPNLPARAFWSAAGRLTGAEGDHGPKRGIGTRWVEPLYRNGLGGVPEILPLTLHRLGRTAIIGVPFELTTNAGDELEEHLLKELQRTVPGAIDRVVVQAYSNGYAQYVATKAEYELQHYEGSSTLFGPNTLQALKEKSADLAQALVSGVAPEGAEPPPIIFPRIRAKGPKDFDKAPRGRKLSDGDKTITAAADRYAPGDRVVVEYFGGDARRRQRTTNILEVRRYDPVQGGFHPVANQGHSSTRIKWMPDGKTHTYQVEWRIPKDLPPGRYQLWHTTTYRPKGSPDEVTDRFHSGIFEVAPRSA